MKKPYFGLTGGWLTFWVSVACSTDMTLFGYDQGVFGGVIVTDDFLDTHHIRGKTSTISTVTAIYDIGCFVGAVAAMWIGEKLGRPKTILVGTTIMTVGAILQIASYSVAQMIVGRIIAGIGNGINTATAPVWQTETSQVKWRGKLVVIELILNIAGFSLSNWMTFGYHSPFSALIDQLLTTLGFHMPLVRYLGGSLSLFNCFSSWSCSRLCRGFQNRLGKRWQSLLRH